MTNTSKPWFLYLIECQDGSIYTGITVDVEQRYAAHKSGKGAKYMRSHPPKQLLQVFEFPNRSEASKAEYAVKQLTASEALFRHHFTYVNLAYPLSAI